MKTQHAVGLVIFGVCLDMVGALLKVRHQAGAEDIFVFAAIFQVVGGLTLLIKLLTKPKVKGF